MKWKEGSSRSQARLYRATQPGVLASVSNPPYITLFLGEIVFHVPAFETIFWSTTPLDAGDRVC